MPKRFTDTNKWEDSWHRKLSVEAKLFWDYICGKANNAGFWEVDFELASFQINIKINENLIITEINKEKERLIYTPDKKYIMIVDFIDFQIGNIKQSNLTNLQKNCIAVLHIFIEKYNDFVSENLRVHYEYLTGIDINKDFKDFKIPNKSNVNNNIYTKNQKDDMFEKIWIRYPRRIDKKSAYKRFFADINTEQDWTNIKIALENYKEYIAKNKIESQFVKHGKTWFNNWRDWLEQPERKNEYS